VLSNTKLSSATFGQRWYLLEITGICDIEWLIEPNEYNEAE